MSSRLRDDCGGHRFLDLRGLLLLAPFAVVTGVLSSAPSEFSTFWRWSLVNTVSLALTAIPVALARWLIVPFRRRPLPLAVTAAIGSVIGAVKGLATSWLAEAFDLIDDLSTDLLGRTLNTAVLGAVVIPAVAALLAAHDRWQHERDLLVVELVRRALDDDRQLDRTPYRRQLVADLTDTRRRLAHLEGTAAAQELRRFVDTGLRPLSAQVLTGTDTPPPLSSGWPLIRVGLTHGTWATVPVTLVFAAATWLLLDRHTSAGDAAVLTGLVCGLVVVALLVGSVLRHHRPHWSPAVLATIVVVVAAAERPIANATVGVIPSLDHVGVPVTSGIWLAQLLVTSMVISAARHERDDIRAQLLDLLGPQGVRDAVGHGIRAVDGREFAYFVHGHVQNQLIAAAERLERSTDRADQAATLHSVLALLDNATRRAPATAPLEARLADIAHRWHGIAEITVTTDHHLHTTPPATVERIAHVVVEAITNAVRHGAAQQIVIDLTANDEAVTLTVTDDGFGPRRGKPGTGSRYLDLVAPQAWSLRPAPDGGSQLTVRIVP